MKFKIETKTLQKIIKNLGVTAKVNTLDSSGRMLIETKDDKLVFLANNSSTAIQIETGEVIIEEPGSLSILYGEINSFISKFSPWDGEHGVKEFNFSFQNDEALIKVKNVHPTGKVSRGRLKLTYYPDYLVAKPIHIDNPTFILNSTIFKDAVSKVIYAIDPNDNRKFIQGMSVKFNENYIYFAGTDGKMLSEYKINNVSNYKEGAFTLTHSFVMGLRRALGDETQLHFDVADGRIKVTFDNVLFWGRTVVGHKYPDYNEDLTKYTHTVTVAKDILMSSLYPMADVLDEDDNKRLSISINNDTLTIFNKDAEFVYEQAVEYTGDFVVDVNGSFMLQTIEAIKDDKLLMKFSNADGYLIFDSGNFENQKALITPIKQQR